MMVINKHRSASVSIVSLCILGLTACSDNASIKAIRVDGSSTVYPITEAIAEEFLNATGGQLPVTVGVSGTGGGFKKFCRGETDISDASRPISKEERKLCAENGIKYIELPVALDALTVVVNSKNDWVDAISVEQLKTIWEPAAQGKITRWNKVDPAWPGAPLHLYGPGPDSGTFDYFTDAIVGEEDASRGDYTASEDDNVLVQGISRDNYALGYFGYAYYDENRDALKALAIDTGHGKPVLPSIQTARSGAYQPLARPMFIYIAKQSAARKAVAQFVRFYLNPDHAHALVTEAGYVPLPDSAYRGAQQKFEMRKTGTAFTEGTQVGVSIEEMLKKERVK
jgi:phosphate transport system substrate-binding protein